MYVRQYLIVKYGPTVFYFYGEGMGHFNVTVAICHSNSELYC